MKVMYSQKIATCNVKTATNKIIYGLSNQKMKKHDIAEDQTARTEKLVEGNEVV